MQILVAFLLHSASSWATLNLAIMDGAVDLRDPLVREYVSEEQLRKIEFNGSNLRDQNLRAPHAHGLGVASRLLHDLPPDRVRLFPIVVKTEVSAWRILKALVVGLPTATLTTRTFRRRMIDEAFAQYHEGLSKILTEQNVRIVNLSTGFDVGDFAEKWMSKLPFVDDIVRSYNKSQESFVRRHPDTLFIFAAGNDKRQLHTKMTHAIPNAGEPNVLIVGSLAYSLRPARYSNHSSELLDVLASGEWQGHHGTSFAAPLVGNTIAADLIAHPELTIAQARERFLSRPCLRDSKLERWCIRGTYLPGQMLEDENISTFPLLYEGPPSRTSFGASLERLSAGGSLELIYDHFETYKAISLKTTKDPLAMRLMSTLIAESNTFKRELNDVTPEPTRTRDRLAKWLSQDGPIKTILPYDLEGRFSRGLVIREGIVTPLDWPSTALAPHVEEILCELGLSRPAA